MGQLARTSKEDAKTEPTVKICVAVRDVVRTRLMGASMDSISVSTLNSLGASTAQGDVRSD